MFEFRLKETTYPSATCDDCGTYSPEKIEIFVNNVQVWYSYTDNHLSEEGTDNSILFSIVNECTQVLIKEIENNFTELERLVWNKNQPGSLVALTPESWNDYKNGQINGLRESISNWKHNCKELPENYFLQLKLIALWYEDEFNEEIKVTGISVSED